MIKWVFGDEVIRFKERVLTLDPWWVGTYFKATTASGIQMFNPVQLPVSNPPLIY